MTQEYEADNIGITYDEVMKAMYGVNENKSVEVLRNQNNQTRGRPNGGNNL